MNHLLVNDLRELCQFYIQREDITSSAVRPQAKEGAAHSHSQANFKSKSNFNSVQSYATDKSTKSNRNRSFSNYLS